MTGGSGAYGPSLLWEADRRYTHDPAFRASARAVMQVVDMDAHEHGEALGIRDRQLVMSGIALGMLHAERRVTTPSTEPGSSE